MTYKSCIRLDELSMMNMLLTFVRNVFFDWINRFEEYSENSILKSKNFDRYIQILCVRDGKYSRKRNFEKGTKEEEYTIFSKVIWLSIVDVGLRFSIIYAYDLCNYCSPRCQYRRDLAIGLRKVSTKTHFSEDFFGSAKLWAYLYALVTWICSIQW
jgi:hypothetical protein